MSSKFAANRYFLLAAACSALLVAGVQADEAPAWLTGPRLERQLDSHLRVHWEGVPLARALNNLARAQRLAVLLDRRLDPSQKLSVSLVDVSLREALERIAQSRGLGVSLLGPVAYLGPPSSARRLRTLAALGNQAVQRVPAEQRNHWNRRWPTRWSRLTTPQELLSTVTEQTGVEIRGMELIPHDLWRGGDLPPLSLVDRLTLIGAGFDLTIRIAPDGRSVTWTPIEEPVRMVRSYRAPGRTGLDAWHECLTKKLPEAEVKLSGGKLWVRGRAEDHEVVAAQLAGIPSRRPRPQAAGEPADAVRITLTKTAASWRAILDRIAAQFQLDVQLDSEAIARAGISTETIVRVNVQEATLDELLHAVLQPVGLAFERDGNVVKVQAVRDGQTIPENQSPGRLPD